MHSEDTSKYIAQGLKQGVPVVLTSFEWGYSSGENYKVYM